MRVCVEVTVRYTRECAPGEEALAQVKLRESIDYFKAMAQMRPMVGDNLRIDVLSVSDATISPG